MKIITLVSYVVFFAGASFGQIVDIEYIYQEKINLGSYMQNEKLRSNTESFNQRLKSKIPLEAIEGLFDSDRAFVYIDTFLLHVAKGQSLFKQKGDIPRSIELKFEGANVKIFSMEYQTRFFIDRKQNTLSGEIPKRGKIIKLYDEIPTLCWDISNESKTMLGLKTFKAELQYCNRSIIAWFAPDIPLQAGPLFYGGLPGLIMELVIDDGLRIYTATTIEKSLGHALQEKKIKAASKHAKTLSKYCAN